MNPAVAPPSMLLEGLLITLPLVLIAVLMPLSVRSRRGIVFGVTLPLQFAESAGVRASVARFRRDHTLVAVAAIMAVVGLLMTHHAQTANLVGMVATFVLLAAGVLLRGREARRLRPHAIVVPLTRSVDLADTGAGSGPLWATALALLPLAAAGLWLHAHTAEMPVRWPQHWNAAGQADGWGSRGGLGLYGQLGVGALLVLGFVALAAFLAYAPGTDGAMRRRYNAPLAVIAWLSASLFSSVALLPALHPASAVPLTVAVVVHLLATVAVVIWMVRRSGIVDRNDGVFAAADAQDYDGTPDSAWHLGLFYYNPEDPALLVAKRFGFGWTLNFGRPAAWIFLGVVAAFIVGPTVFARLTK